MTATIIQIIGIAIVIVLQIVLTYLTKKAQNRADKEDASKISYEQEHGRNLATKDDIDNIIKELEKVKAEVSLTEQRKHNLIEKRNENLLGVIKAAEKIRIMKIRLISLINNCNSDGLTSLIDELDRTLVSLRINVQIVTALANDEKEVAPLTLFSYDITNTGLKYIEYATNAISYIIHYEHAASKAESSKTPNELDFWSGKANERFENIHQLSDHAKEYKNPNWEKDETLYIKYLNILYRKGQMVGI